MPESAPNNYPGVSSADLQRAPPVVVVQASPAFFLRVAFQNMDLPENGHVILGDIATNIQLQVRCLPLF